MSIINLPQIGEWLKKNQADMAMVIGFILVAVVAFGAGRLSAPEIVRNPVVIEEPDSTGAVNLYGDVSQPLKTAEQGSPAVTAEKGMFVASRGGTKYHWPWCSWGERIKQTNQVWFNSEKEAQVAGYSPCGCIKNQAPAGYAP